MDITIKWQSDEGIWRDFDLSDLENKTVSAVAGIFGFKVPVIAKQGAKYFVNNHVLQRQYQQAGKNVMMIQDIKTSDKMFSEVGFLP